jgi:hypothetical protein
MPRAAIILIALLQGSSAGCKGSIHTNHGDSVALCAGGEQMARPGSQKGESDMSEVIDNKWVSYVESIGKYDKGPPAPLDVEFFGHAAVFDLERTHPCFARWLTMLKKSEEQHATIVFTYGGIGTAIRSVEIGERITGVVEEIIHGMQPNSTGFTIPHHPDIFLIPNDHPRLLDWLVLMHKSRNGKMKIVFAYDAYHRRVTSLALAEH